MLEAFLLSWDTKRSLSFKSRSGILQFCTESNSTYILDIVIPRIIEPNHVLSLKWSAYLEPISDVRLFCHWARLPPMTNGKSLLPSTSTLLPTSPSSLHWMSVDISLHTTADAVGKFLALNCLRVLTSTPETALTCYLYQFQVSSIRSTLLPLFLWWVSNLSLHHIIMHYILVTVTLDLAQGLWTQPRCLCPPNIECPSALLQCRETYALQNRPIRLGL